MARTDCVERRRATVTLRAVAAALACTVALLGCAAAPTVPPEPKAAKPQAAQPPVNLSGYSAAFKEGFNDGCSSARGRAQRDEARFQGDGQYALGWQDGRGICARR